jgi:hypothetical protein
MKDYAGLSRPKVDEQLDAVKTIDGYLVVVDQLNLGYVGELHSPPSGPWEAADQPFNVDDKIAKEIKTKHLPALLSEFANINSGFREVLDQSGEDFDQKTFEAISLYALLVFDKIAFLEMGQRYGKFNININALFKVASETFNKNFSNVFWDVPEDSAEKLFGQAYAQVYHLIHPEHWR